MKRIWYSLAKLWVVLAMVFSGAIGCNDSDGGPDTSNIGDNDINTVVCIGDSVTFGTGLPSAQSYPAQLAGLTGKRVINSGVPGETSGSGAGRVGGQLGRHNPAFLLIIYGANDIIRGTGIDRLAANVRSMVQQAKANQTIPVVGSITPMFGARSTFNPTIDTANGLLRSVAKEEGVDYVNINSSMQDEGLFADGLHPTAAGASIIASKFEGQVQ
jgi:acyl-CoA thioesterase I